MSEGPDLTSLRAAALPRDESFARKLRGEIRAGYQRATWLSIALILSFAILDATNSAYPGYILSDDIGEVDESPCACGRNGQSVHFRRRRQGAELGCCAVSIEKFIESREIVEECRVPVEVKAG